MRLRLGTSIPWILIAVYMVIPVTAAYAGHLPAPPPPIPHPVPCSHCPVNAPELDLTVITSGLALAAGGAFFLLERIRRRR
jgi:hypothetical protein